MPILFTLGTLALVIFLGWFARHLKILSSAHTRGMSSYIYYFALPALFFEQITRTDLTTIDSKIIIGSIAPILALVALLLLLHLVKILSKENFVLLALAIVFGSNAFFGITFFQAFAGAVGLKFAVISSSVLGPVGIALTIYIFEYATSHGKAWCFCGKILRNPLIISILAGTVFSILKIPFTPVLDAAAMLGQTAGPLAIFALGAFIFENFSLTEFKKSLPFSIFRLLALPAATFLILNFWLKPTGNLNEFLLLQSGIPAAISLSVFAERYNFRVATISNFVVGTSLGSFVIIGIAYFLVN